MAIPIEIDVWQGEIAELEVDAILVPASESLFMTNPVGRAVKLRAGEAVEREAVQQGPVLAGSAVITGGGQLAAPYVIHVVGVGHDRRSDRERLARAIGSALELAAHLDLSRLATAGLGTEHGAFEAADAAEVLAQTLSSRADAGSWLPSSLVVAAATPGEATAYRAALAALGVTR